MTKLFFVVRANAHAAEIFETYEEATTYFNTFKYDDHPDISVAMVKNYFFEEDLKKWNYEDLSDTFKHVSFI